MLCTPIYIQIPNDLGTILAAREFRPPAVPSAVESVIRVEAPLGLPIHFATWCAASLFDLILSSGGGSGSKQQQAISSKWQQSHATF